MRNYSIIPVMAAVLLFSSASFGFTPFTEKHEVYVYAVMEVKDCKLNKVQEGFWMSTVAKVDKAEFHMEKYRNKAKSEFRNGRNFLEDCTWDVHTFEPHDSMDKAREAKKTERQQLLKRARVHPWRLNF